MMNEYIPDNETKNSNSLITGKKLAEILGVSASALSEAVKKGYHCGGYPVLEWAEFNRFDRVAGYDVPEFLLKEQQIEEATRDNPDEDKADNQSSPQERIVNNNYSLLPAGENYANPVGLASLSMVLKHSLGSDTPQSRAIVGGALAILGAITAHSVTDSGIAAGLGAGAGLGIALYFYKNSKNVKPESFITPSLPEQAPRFSGNSNRKTLVQSGYLVY